MVWVLQTRVQDELSFNRRLDTRQAAQLASSPAGQTRESQRHRPSMLAKRILCPAGFIYADRSPRPSMPIREGGPVTGKPDAGNPPVRFGGRGGRNQPASPTPITGYRGPPSAPRLQSESGLCYRWCMRNVRNPFSGPTGQAGLNGRSISLRVSGGVFLIVLLL